MNRVLVLYFFVVYFMLFLFNLIFDLILIDGVDFVYGKFYKVSIIRYRISSFYMIDFLIEDDYL